VAGTSSGFGGDAAADARLVALHERTDDRDAAKTGDPAAGGSGPVGAEGALGSPLSPAER
jgi:hypothetical protein